MTWMSYSTKALTLFGVLPLVLKQFNSGDIILWYLFSTVISLQMIADFGFRQTFTRIISYAFGGAKDIERHLGVENGGVEQIVEMQPNLKLLTNIVSTMKYIYCRLTLVVFFLMIIFGTWSMAKPILNSSYSVQSWISWIIVVFVSCIGFYGKIYLNFLEGLNKIALVRRVEALTSIGSILSSLLILIFASSLLNLVLVNQFWVLVATFRDYYLCKKINNGIYNNVSLKQPFDREIFRKIWGPAWRSGISGFMSIGLTNLTGLIYAQIGSTEAVASYLLALRIINQIKEISMAPFYSKLPSLAMLRVNRNMSEFIKNVKRGMFLSHLVFIVGFICVGLLSNFLLKFIHSEVQFVSPFLWTLLGVAFFMHRFGAMHIQVYMTTNHIVSHIADGISGLLYLVSSIILSRYIGIYAVPIGMLIGYLGFYSWYAAKYSYRSMNVKFLTFELATSAVPSLLLFLYIILMIMTNRYEKNN